MEFLKNVLGEKYEEFKGLVDAYNNEHKDKPVKLADLSTGEYVAKRKYSDDIKDVTDKLETANATITTLKNANKDNEDLQNEIKGYKATIDSLNAQADKTAKTYALKEALSKQGVLDPDYVIFKQGGIDGFTFDNKGNTVGIADVVAKLKEDTALAHLFKPAQQQYNPQTGNTNVTKNPFAKETFSLTEQSKLFKENPAQAKAMAKAAGTDI